MNAVDKETTFAYWNMIRGVVSPIDYITATVLINEVRGQVQERTCDETPEQVYSILL